MDEGVPWTRYVDLVGSFVDAITSEDLAGAELFDAIEGLSIDEARSVITELTLRDFARRRREQQDA